MTLASLVSSSSLSLAVLSATLKADTGDHTGWDARELLCAAGACNTLARRASIDSVCKEFIVIGCNVWVSVYAQKEEERNEKKISCDNLLVAPNPFQNGFSWD